MILSKPVTSCKDTLTIVIRSITRPRGPTSTIEWTCTCIIRSSTVWPRKKLKFASIWTLFARPRLTRILRRCSASTKWLKLLKSTSIPSSTIRTRERHIFHWWGTTIQETTFPHAVRNLSVYLILCCFKASPSLLRYTTSYTTYTYSKVKQLTASIVYIYRVRTYFITIKTFLVRVIFHLLFFFNYVLLLIMINWLSNLHWILLQCTLCLLLAVIKSRFNYGSVLFFSIPSILIKIL